MYGKYLNIFFPLAFLVSTASAGEPEYSKNFTTCMEKSGGVTLNMRDCLAQETKTWEARLEKTYKFIIPLLEKRKTPSNTNVKDGFVKAHQEWLNYRQAQCSYYISRTGGTIDLINGASCWLEETAHRTLELEKIQEMEKAL